MTTTTSIQSPSGVPSDKILQVHDYLYFHRYKGSVLSWIDAINSILNAWVAFDTAFQDWIVTTACNVVDQYPQDSRLQYVIEYQKRTEDIIAGIGSYIQLHAIDTLSMEVSLRNMDLLLPFINPTTQPWIKWRRLITSSDENTEECITSLVSAFHTLENQVSTAWNVFTTEYRDHPLLKSISTSKEAIVALSNRIQRLTEEIQTLESCTMIPRDCEKNVEALEKSQRSKPLCLKSELESEILAIEAHVLSILEPFISVCETIIETKASADTKSSVNVIARCIKLFSNKKVLCQKLQCNFMEITTDLQALLVLVKTKSLVVQDYLLVLTLDETLYDEELLMAHVQDYSTKSQELSSLVSSSTYKQAIKMKNDAQCALKKNLEKIPILVSEKELQRSALQAQVESLFCDFDHLRI